jgi:hypothetical protein
MTLPGRDNVIRVGALLSVIVISGALSSAAGASNGDDGRARHENLHHQDSGWRGPWTSPLFGVRVYPGYPAPIYSAPYTPYYAPPPPYVPLPPVVLSFGFRWH